MIFFKYIYLILWIIFSANFTWAQTSETVLPVGLAEPVFMESYPHLKNYIYKEPASGFYFGVGGSPVGVVADRMIFGVNFFQLHYLNDPWDVEILNAGYGFTRTGDTDLASDHFTFRTSLKYKFTKLISLGFTLGYELVSFQNVDAKLFKAPFVTQDWEPFSSRGWIYGIIASQTLPYKGKYLFRINEVVYKESYSVTETKEGWGYLFKNPSVQADSSRIEAGYVAAIEFSILY